MWKGTFPPAVFNSWYLEGLWGWWTEITWRFVDIQGVLQVRRSKFVQCAVYKEENLKCYTFMDREPVKNRCNMHCFLRLRLYLFCEGRISVLKRWFKTPIQNAVHGSTVYASLEKKTISWACTAHCSRLLFELKWTGKAFIWRHLNVVICDFAFMLPPQSAFCSNHDRKRTFLGCVYTYFTKAESAFWNADSKRRSKTPFTGVLFMLPSRRRRFREHALRIVRGYCSSSSEPERRLYDVI